MDGDQFAQLTEKPKLDEIDFNTLIDYYEKYLAPYIYEFELDNGDKFSLKFGWQHFPHLIGLHKPAEAAFGRKSPKVLRYKGMYGYKQLKKGKITKETLKNLNKSAYKDMKSKMVNFYLLHKFLTRNDAAEYIRVQNNINNIDILLYEKQDDFYIHLGITKAGGEGQYAPTTFFIESITEHSTGDKYIQGQNPLQIVVYRRISTDTKIETSK